MIDKFSIFNGAKFFSSGIYQKYLVFIPVKKYKNILLALLESWKSNRISEESIENIIRSDRNLAPIFVDQHLLLDMNFNEHCLIKNNISNKK